MTLGQYRVWCVSDGQDEEGCSLIQAFDHEDAARDWAEQDYNEEPFSSVLEVHVRSTFGGDDGELKIFEVEAEPTIHFSATQVSP